MKPKKSACCPDIYRERGRPDPFGILSTTARSIRAFFMASFFVYIIYSSKLDKYYVGHTHDLLIRVEQHNSGISTFTSKANDWVLKYSEPFHSREDAFKREIQIKKKKSRKYIEWLINEI